MHPVRDIKVLFSALAGAFLLLVGVTNLSDYPTNLAFVRQVSRMEGLFSGEALRWRSIHAAWAQHLLYACIIAWELGCGWLACFGAWRMWRARHAGADAFLRAGTASTYAYGGAVALWFGGFATVAGEWFLMWRGAAASTQGTAFHLTTVFLLLLLFHTSGGRPSSHDRDR
jgi:predicted small integral membrane protein